MRQGRVGWTLAWAACAGVLCAGPALAGLTVEIVQPETDPFTSQVDNPAFFAAVAYVDGQELPGGEVTWEWDFGDQSAHSTDNPTTHVFETVGQFTVTVTATHAGQQGQDSATAIVEDRDPHPAGGTLSIYVAHDGTWVNYRSGQYEEAEIEDFVAVFTPPEQMSEDPEVWFDHVVNDPGLPAGWLFYEASTPMELHVVIRDTGNRLGEVVVTNHETGAPVGTLEADVLGAEIDGSLSIDPDVESVDLNIKDTNGVTLALAEAAKGEVKDAVVVPNLYGWPTNRGDQHEGCPYERSDPWGNPRERSGRDATPTVFAWRACCGRLVFENDSQAPSEETPTYVLKDKNQCGNPGPLPDGLPEAVAGKVAAEVVKAQARFVGTTDVHVPYVVPPFSRGVVHFPVNVQGEVAAVVCQPYREVRRDRWDPTASIAASITEQVAAGATATPSFSWAAAATAGLALKIELQKYVVGETIPGPDVWGVIASSGTSVIESISGITAPVTFELRTDIPGGPAQGTGTATVGPAWTTPAPPGGINSPINLAFGQDGTCEVELAKGFKWTATGQVSPYHTQGSVGPFDFPSATSTVITCNLQVLLNPRVKARNPQGQPTAAYIELEKFENGVGTLIGMGDTVTVGEPPNTEEVWTSMPLTPGSYRVRGKARTGADPQWSGWQSLQAEIGIEQIVNVTVTPGQMQPPP